MDHFNDTEQREDARPDREGLYDAQLTFPSPFVEAPPPLTLITKRDGSRVPFDKHKIADAIFRAAQAIGGDDRDRAESLASAVTLHLTKKLNGQVPTVDQVDDAVERVLIHMDHARTALSYTRYRDRRARLRRLRQGDTGALLSEIEEAWRNPERPGGGAPMFVRTSAETVAGWDRAKIVEALVRETGLDAGIANLIAIEVEQQIVAAKVQALTGSLIRELVGAKLIEHGLEAHHRRHVRLGVPLYDAERIIQGPSLDGAPQDPEATGRVLAEAVKREFALSQVFSAEVGEAHVRGDVYVHDLGAVDRLHSSVQSLEYVSRFGVGLHDARTFSRPPKYPDTLLAQMVNLSATLQHHFAGAATWDAANVFFAPFVEQFGDREMRQIAQMLIYEYAYRAIVQGSRAPVTNLVVCWDVPAHLRDAEAVEPGGVVGERTYGSYARAAQRLAWALFDVFREGGERDAAFSAPCPLIPITPEFFACEGYDAFLEHAARVAAARGNVHFLLQRAAETSGVARSWQPRETVVQRVTLNLARAAYQGGNEAALFAELERWVRIAVQAHVEKRTFVEKLLALRKLGPLSLLTVEREGEPYFRPDDGEYWVGVTGLNECVQYLTGMELHDSEEAMALGGRVMNHLRWLCVLYGERVDIRCVAAQTADAALDHRFAVIDMQEFPDAVRRVVKTDTVTQDLFYTPGARVNSAAPLSPMERTRLEGRLHEYAPLGAETVVCMPDADTSPRAISDFIQKAFHQTPNRRIAVLG